MFSSLTSVVRKQALLACHAITLLRSAGDASLGIVAALVLVAGLVPVASVYVTREVVDRLVVAMNAGGVWSAVWPLVVWALIGGALLLGSEIVSGVLSWACSLHEERLKDHITSQVQVQSARLDLEFYESPEFFDRLHRAREEASYRPAELCHAFVDVLQGTVTLVGLGAVLVAFGPWLPVVLFVGALPVLYVVANHALEYMRWRRRVTQDERRAWYYDFALTSSDYAAELRVFGWSPRFREGYRALRARLRSEHLALTRKRAVADTAAAATSLAVLGGGFAWVVQRALQGLVSLGQLAAFCQAFATGLSTMRSLLGGLGRVYANALFIENLTEFFALEPGVVSPPAAVVVPPRLSGGIRFRDVGFSYPGSTRSALHGFDLFVPAGQRVAIVGPNGAGKSTLIKLLCRLYDPSEGAIEFDGVDIRRFNLNDLRKLVSPLFQSPVHYFQSVDDNIRMGSVSSSLTPADIRRASAAAGASRLVDELPQGYDTLLGKWFDDGTELSAGEWQRVALARTLARPSQVLVLDEPTSALDPWSESEWYDRFCDAAGDRTSVIITHRFSTAMQADMIHVMHDGRIVESGTHDELVARGGRYASSWLATRRQAIPHPAMVAS